MCVFAADVAKTSATQWLVLGAFAGYVLMMWTNPVRESLRDGWQAVRRYPSLWLVLGTLGCVNALFSIAARAYLSIVLPPEAKPVFVWARDDWRDPELWLSGSPASLWWLPHNEFVSAVRDSIRPGIENVAGLFSVFASTFPISAFLGPLLLFAWRGRARVLLQALNRRMGWRGWSVYGLLTVAGFAAAAKPILYFTPSILPPQLWMEWGQLIAAVAFIFEFLLGFGCQVFLILLAFAWVRGLNFDHHAMIDVAVRRFVCVLQWAALILLASMLLIEAPLVLKNFPSLATHFPEEELFEGRLANARAALAGFVLLTATVQITMTLHATTLRHAMREHFRFVSRAWWPLAWFMITALFHFVLIQALQENVERGVGEGTALWVVWRVLSPWLVAAVGAWLLASWVCVYKRHSRPAGARPQIA
jgi:hypothetical protein